MNNGKICVSVCAETADEFIEKIKRAEEFGDLVELRFDCLKADEIDKLTGLLKPKDHFIKTFRAREQGGSRDLTLREREAFWNSGEDWCGADFEEDVVEKAFGWLYKPIICSHHDFSKTPENLTDIYDRLKATNADVIKIAVQTDDITDSISIWKLLEKSKNIIPIAMGEAGKWTRILGLAHGAFLTYASLETGSETAPGQVSAKDLIEVYRAKELDTQTKVYGIIGNPVAQSVSPYMHNAAFKYYEMNDVYVPFEVKDLDEFIRRIVKPETREVAINLCGFSVTIPHKQAIIKHLDFIDETAQIIGAVNTVKIADGKLHGYNTDAKGFIEPLHNAYGDLKNVKVTILGSGGSARAAIYALKNEGAEVNILARNMVKAAQLGKEFQVNFDELTTHHSSPVTTDILVNTTPLGMKGKFERQTPMTADQIENVKMIYDLVYNPFETRLIQEARKARVPTIGGLAMLVAQGMEQFKLWTGKDAPMKEMSAAALRKLR